MRLELLIESGYSSFKFVNSTMEKTTGQANHMLLNIRELTCEARFIIIPLDDFDIILGYEFMRRANVDPTPHLQCLEFISHEDPIMLRTVRKPQ